MPNNKMNVNVARFGLKSNLSVKSEFSVKLSIVLFALTLTACSHQSTVKPSAGHIDGKVNTNNNAPNSSSNNSAGSANNATAPIPKLVRSVTQVFQLF